MSKTLIQEILLLANQGWRPYSAEPAGFVYERLHCAHPKKAYWFVRGDIYLCVGCGNRCALSRPVGFVPPLPIRYPQPDMPYSLSPRELAARKDTLRVHEVAYCLNVSPRKVRDWIAEGRLTKLRESPLRIKASEVRDMMDDFDE